MFKTQDFIKIINEYENIIIFHHINPDGDCLGSQAGLKKLIQKNFKNKNVFSIGDANGALDIMNFTHDEIPNDEILKNSLAIIADANYKNRIQNVEVLEKIKHKFRIDHHRCEDDLDAKYHFVDDSFSSTCEQITFLAQELNLKMDKDIALFLYCGLLTDSGRFFYEKTSPRTHQLAAFLLETGFDFFNFHLKLSKRTIKEIEFQKEVFNNYQTSNNIIYYFLSHKKVKHLNLSDSEKNRVDFLANIEGFNIWIFFIENEDKSIRVRIRSSKYPINELANKFNGGGHRLAAGASLKNKEEIPLLIKEANKMFNK